MEKQFWLMPSHWKKWQATKFAHAIGLETKVEGDEHYVEVKWKQHWVGFTDYDDYIPYRVYLKEMDDWNGWQQPFFPVAEAIRLCEEEDNSDGFRMEEGNMIYKTEYYDDEVISLSSIVVDGEEIAGYHLGCGLCWSKVSAKDLIDRLAVQFATVLEEWLTPEQFQELKTLNALTTDDNICYSHDYCDANMAMDEAFKKLFGRSCSFGDEDPAGADLALINAAWDQAKDNNFQTL